MRSIRTKITILTISSVMIAIIVAALLGTLAIRSMAEDNAERTLHLLCETGQKNLDAYFDSIEQSVGMVASFADSGDVSSAFIFISSRASSASSTCFIRFSSTPLLPI